MARARNIKPGFFRNEVLAELDPLTRLLFSGLWTVADREGRLEDRPRRIKADVLPYDDDADVDAMLAALAEKSFIARYKYGASSYIQILQFHKHQNPHKSEAQSVIPPMDTAEPSTTDSGNVETTNPAGTGKSPEHSTSTVQAHELNSTNRADFLNTDSLIPDSGLLEEEPRERGDADAPASVSDPPAVPKPRTPKQQASDRKFQRSSELFAAYCRGLGIDPDGDDAQVYRDRAFRELKPVADKPVPIPDDIERLTRFLSRQSWRDEPPKVPSVLGSYAGWASKGKPDEPEPKPNGQSRASPNGNGRNGGYSAAELLSMGRKDTR